MEYKAESTTLYGPMHLRSNNIAAIQYKSTQQSLQLLPSTDYRRKKWQQKTPAHYTNRPNRVRYKARLRLIKFINEYSWQEEFRNSCRLASRASFRPVLATYHVEIGRCYICNAEVRLSCLLQHIQQLQVCTPSSSCKNTSTVSCGFRR